MSRFVDFRSPLTPAQRELERLVRSERIQGLVMPRYFSGGVPSFNPPSSNFLTNLFGKSAEGSIALGDGAGAALNSGFSLLSRQMYPLGSNDIPLKTEGDVSFMRDGSIKPTQDLSGVEYFDALDPAARFVLEQNGVQPDQFKDVKTIEEATDRYNQIARDVELRQAIVRYNEVHPHFATATGLLGFGLDVVTDPITLATLGAGIGLSGAKGATTAAGKVGIRAVTKATAQNIANDGFKEAAKRLGTTVARGQIDLVPTIVRDAANGDVIMRHLIATTGGGGAIASFDGLAQLAEHDRRAEALGIQADFDYSFLRGGLSFAMGAGLANLGAFARGGTPKAITNADIINNSPTSMIGRRLENKARRGEAAADARADIYEIGIVERVDRIARAGYDTDAYEEISRILTRVLLMPGAYTPEGAKAAARKAGVVFNKETTQVFSLQEMGDFFAQIPTQQEALTALRTGDFSKTPRVSAINSEINVKFKELRSLEGKAVVDDADLKAIKSLRKKLRSLEREKHGLIYGKKAGVNGNERGYFFTEESPDSRRIQSIVSDSPATDIYGPSNVRSSRMIDLLGLSNETKPGRVEPIHKSATYAIFNALSKLGSLGTLARSSDKIAKISDNPIAQSIAKMYGAFDSRIANDHFGSSDGTGVVTVTENLFKVRIMRGELLRTTSKLFKGKSREQQQAIGFEAARIRTGTLKAADASKEAVELAKAVGKYYDRMGDMAVRNGSLKNRIDNYMNVILKDDISSTKIDKLSSLLAFRWMKEFDPINQMTGGEMPTRLHNKTMVRIKLFDEDLNVIHPDYIDPELGAIKPMKFTDLTEEHKRLYLKELEGSLKLEAEFAIQRRLGRNKSIAEDPILRDERSEASYRQENRASRAIEQEFWYSKEVQDLDVVNSDINEITGFYERGFGAYSARQETMTNIFGEAARFEDFITTVRNKANALDSTDPEKQLLLNAINDLEKLNERTLSHNKIQATGTERLLQPLVDVAAATIQQGILVAMQTEVATVVLRNIFHKQDIKYMMDQMRQIFNGAATKDDLLAWGFSDHYEHGVSRMLGESAYDPVGSVGKGARWWRDKSRLWFGEAALTARLKRMHYVSTHVKTSRRLIKSVDKLDALRTVDLNDPKAFGAAAREAGFGSNIELAEEVRRLGLHTPEAQRALRRYRDLGPDSLSHPETGMKLALAETDPDLKREMMELNDNLRRYARQHTDNVIVTRSSGTTLQTNDVLGNMIFQFLSYPTSWFNGFLRQTSRGPNHILAGYFVSYMLGEVMGSMVRDVTLRGMSPDEVLADWEENFIEKASLTAARIPLLGGWSDLAWSPIIASLTDEPLRLGLESNPSISIPKRVGAEAIRNVKRLADGEELSEFEFKNLSRVLPGGGFPVTQSLIPPNN